MKAKALVACPIGRWKIGEVGVLLENDFPEKYAYFVRFPGVVPVELAGTKFDAARDYYFYKDEIMLTNDGGIRSVFDDIDD